MTVRAKFRCMNVQSAPNTSPDQTYITASFTPVWEQDGENKKWSAATPSGQLVLNITNPAAAEWFEMGKEYWLDIHPVEAGDK